MQLSHLKLHKSSIFSARAEPMIRAHTHSKLEWVAECVALVSGRLAPLAPRGIVGACAPPAPSTSTKRNKLRSTPVPAVVQPGRRKCPRRLVKQTGGWRPQRACAGATIASAASPPEWTVRRLQCPWPPLPARLQASTQGHPSASQRRGAPLRPLSWQEPQPAHLLWHPADAPETGPAAPQQLPQPPPPSPETPEAAKHQSGRCVDSLYKACAHAWV